MTVLNNDNGSFTIIYFYFFKILVFPKKVVVYIDVILQACCRRKLTEKLDIVGSMYHLAILHM